MSQTNPPKAISWSHRGCRVLDQTKLPREVVYLECENVNSLVEAIQCLAIRGAPLLGVAGGFGVWLAAKEALAQSEGQRAVTFDQKVKKLREARPTAVNLAWGVDQALRALPATALSEHSLAMLKETVDDLFEKDILGNKKMAEFGAKLFSGEGSVITVCNTGDLCTAFGGTAFGVIREAYRQQRLKHVYALETRPLLQGLRLTGWELERNQIPFTMICDNTAAFVMKEKKISGVIAGADRIAANGDAANKVGTYMLAILAKFHQIPFYIAAPRSTFDLATKEGRFIEIEQRSPREIFDALGENQPREPYPVFSPAFDVTPHSLISAIVTEAGVLEHPDELSVPKFLREKFG